jgi:hypothetical protein
VRATVIAITAMTVVNATLVLLAAKLAEAVAANQHLYRANVFPAMKATWGVYRDNLGHMTSDGFRCHDGNHVTRAGKATDADCSYCHDQS